MADFLILDGYYRNAFYDYPMLHCKQKVCKMEIIRSCDFSFFLVVIVTSSTAIPLDDEDISREESFENEVDGYFQEGIEIDTVK